MKAKKNNPPYRTVVVFGVFDGIHPGHENFLQQARVYAGHLVAIVARDSQVREHKNKHPHFSERSRRARIAAHPLVCHAYLGDKKSGEYKILRCLHPDVIVLGYDQYALKKDLEHWMRQTGTHIPTQAARAYKPQIYHTSFYTRPHDQVK